MVLRVNKRHFVRQFSKYLENPGTYELEAWGKVCQVVEIRQSLVIENKAIQSSVGFNKEKLKLSNEYGCGCPKTEKTLCVKHGRY